ncbi:MAG TPA: radical SAM/SPASM domain-containing protein [Planktothrix sp.]|jgi:radical SAM protein with 4Fe4S-binding SPASM domain
MRKIEPAAVVVLMFSALYIEDCLTGGSQMTQRKLFEIVLIETRNTCTRKCWFCKFGQERQDSEIREMDWDTIERVVFNLRDLDFAGRISWFWINEPLLDKRLFDILKFTREQCPRAFLSIITNGDLLNEKTQGKLFESGLDGLRISVYDDKTLAKMNELPRSDRVVMLDMRNPDSHLENRAGNILQNRDLFESDKLGRIKSFCARPFEQLVIDTQGQVVLCCADMYSDVVMGDATKDRLEDIWNNERFEQYRNTLNESGRSGLKLCESCSYSGGSHAVRLPFDDSSNKHLVLQPAVDVK